MRGRTRWPSVAAALLVMGCATVRPPLAGTGGSGLDAGPICGGLAQRGHWPDYSAGSEALLAPFLACASPAEFVELQRGVDMPRLVEALDDWSAVRLGAMGPLVAGADVLTRKRAAFLVDAEERYGAPFAEVFALFVLNAAFDDELRALLALLAGDKQLQRDAGADVQRAGGAGAAGPELADFPERETRPATWGGAWAAPRGTRSTAASSAVGPATWTSPRRSPGCRRPTSRPSGRVQDALARPHFAPGHVALGCFDCMTFGVPLGFYHLVVGTAEGGASLWKGDYEQATRELAPAALLVALYAGGKGLRALSASEGLGWRGLPLRVAVELRLGALRESGGAAGGAAGGERRRAAGPLPPGAAGGGRPGGGRRRAGGAGALRGGGKRGPGPGLPGQGEAGAGGARPRPRGGRNGRAGGRGGGPHRRGGGGEAPAEEALASGPAPAGEPGRCWSRCGPGWTRRRRECPRDFPLWREYVAYWEQRLAELKAGQTAKGPLRWDGYQWLMEPVRPRAGVRARHGGPAARRRGAAPEAAALARGLRAAVHRDQRGSGQAGVEGVRYADVLVIEEGRGQPPRVETFSFKSRDLSGMADKPVAAQMMADAAAALRYYGETLNIRRPSLKHLGPRVQVRRVRLVYEGGELMPDPRRLEASAGGMSGPKCGAWRWWCNEEVRLQGLAAGGLA